MWLFKITELLVCYPYLQPILNTPFLSRYWHHCCPCAYVKKLVFILFAFTSLIHLLNHPPALLPPKSFLSLSLYSIATVTRVSQATLTSPLNPLLLPTVKQIFYKLYLEVIMPKCYEVICGWWKCGWRLFSSCTFLYFKHFHRKFKTKCSIKTKTAIKCDLLRRAFCPLVYPYIIISNRILLFSGCFFNQTLQQYTFYSFAGVLSLSLTLTIRPWAWHHIYCVDYRTPSTQAYVLPHSKSLIHPGISHYLSSHYPATH